MVDSLIMVKVLVLLLLKEFHSKESYCISAGRRYDMILLEL